MFVDLEVGHLTEAVTGRRWSPVDVRREVISRLSRYSSRGLQRGDRVLIRFGNRLEFFAELLAIWRLGGCAIPLDTRLTAFEFNNFLKASQTRFVVIDDTTPVEETRTSTETSVVHTLETSPKAWKANSADLRPSLDDDALILFTSGSTGDPKGVVHTHRSLRARWIALVHALGVHAYRRTLCLLPTHFGHGLICNCLFPWLSGCDLFLAPPFKAALLMRLGSLIDEHKITFLSSVPSMWNLTLKVAAEPTAGTLERLHVGSAPLSAALWKDIQRWSAINEVFNAYGITETGSWVAGTTGGPVAPENGLIGEPWGATVKVLRTRDTAAALTPDARCAPGEEGMVWLNTPALMKGYFRRDDLTDAVVSQGWFMTGDIGVVDERGRLFLRGRERDEINKGGMKIAPADIDAVVGEFDDTADVCSFGFADAQYGENVAMAVVLKNRTDATCRRLNAWMSSRLAEHKRPVRWYVLEEIPRTSRGKINRANVRDSCLRLEPLDFDRILKDE